MRKQQNAREWFANGALISLALIVCCIDPSVAGNGAVVHAHSGDAQVLVGAGDIADCSDLSGARATAKLLGSLPGTVFVLGDLTYGDGTSTELMRCYDETWGQYKDRTRPAPGNHEYETKDAPADALGYFQYFNGV